MTEKFKYHQ